LFAITKLNDKKTKEVLAKNYSITDEKQQKVAMQMERICLEKWPVGLSIAVTYLNS
jgi:hypothetical protein